jgi:hypothetical protein
MSEFPNLDRAGFKTNSEKDADEGKLTLDQLKSDDCPIGCMEKHGAIYCNCEWMTLNPFKGLKSLLDEDSGT